MSRRQYEQIENETNAGLYLQGLGQGTPAKPLIASFLRPQKSGNSQRRRGNKRSKSNRRKSRKVSRKRKSRKIRK